MSTQIDEKTRPDNVEIPVDNYDNEKSGPRPHLDSYGSEEASSDTPKPFWRRYLTKIILAVFWVLMTAYFIATLVLHPEDPLVRCLLYAFISLKIFFEFVPTTIVTRPISIAWKPIGRLFRSTKTLYKYGIGITLALTLLIAVAFGTPETANGTLLQRGQSLLGLFVFTFLMFATSRSPKNINWQTVVVGIILQFLLGIFVIKTYAGYSLFHWLSLQCAALLGFAKEGAKFVAGDFANEMIFVFTVLPGVLFFASFIQIVYYTGAMQWLVVKFAWFFKSLMDTSGSESVVAAASPFVGQGESALLVKPFLAEMTIAELHQVMTSGFATIAGSVLIAFINMKIDPQSLITSCVMSIPCSLALSKMRYPELEESKTKGTVTVPKSEEKEVNILHAAANGAAQGVTLVLLIGGTLLAVISLLALVNSLLTWLGSFVNIEKLTLELIMGYVFVPFAFFVGVPPSECYEVGKLMAIKMFVNEFAAFAELTKLEAANVLSVRANVLAIYSLCGFANLASIGIQVGCLGAMAPSRKHDLANVAFSAMLTGTICTFVSACVAGLLI
ncbi:hypothetical protein K502DRAFT_194686 [Neoconidiobolus thromboides FSU 785]|nr:hypothetical protein K502DRAFT_194686 [Neoconidiobolus thromboides FSU 785]